MAPLAVGGTEQDIDVHRQSGGRKVTCVLRWMQRISSRVETCRPLSLQLSSGAVAEKQKNNADTLIVFLLTGGTGEDHQ